MGAWRLFGGVWGRCGPLVPGKGQIAEEEHCKEHSGEADVEGVHGGLEAEFDGMGAGLEVNASHQVVAAQQLIGFPVHEDLPFGVKPVV